MTNREQVARILESALQAQAQKARALAPEYEDLWLQIAALLRRGGKRTRPELVIRAYRAFGGTNMKAIYQVAASQELLHAFILMHDDIIDRDDIRWGGPNIRGHYREHFKTGRSTAAAEHFANAWALLAGDLCLNLAHDLLRDSGFLASQVRRADQLISETFFTMVGGELLDTAAPLRGHATHEEIIAISRLKTAHYSFSTPLELGAMFASASTEARTALRAFGEPAGVAFQIRDDILGIYGDAATLGKPNLTDLREGKQTLLLYYGLQSGDQQTVRWLQQLYGKKSVTAADLLHVRKLLHGSGALEKTQMVMREYAHTAEKALGSGVIPKELCRYLQKLLQFSLSREN